jgi:lipoate-protein ligase B
VDRGGFATYHGPGQLGRGNIHAFVLLRKAVPSSQRDIAEALAALRGALGRP